MNNMSPSWLPQGTVARVVARVYSCACVIQQQKYAHRPDIPPRPRHCFLFSPRQCFWVVLCSIFEPMRLFRNTMRYQRIFGRPPLISETPRSLRVRVHVRIRLFLGLALPTLRTEHPRVPIAQVINTAKLRFRIRQCRHLVPLRLFVSIFSPRALTIATS